MFRVLSVSDAARVSDRLSELLPAGRMDPLCAPLAPPRCAATELPGGAKPTPPGVTAPREKRTNGLPV